MWALVQLYYLPTYLYLQAMHMCMYILYVSLLEEKYVFESVVKADREMRACTDQTAIQSTASGGGFVYS